MSAVDLTVDEAESRPLELDIAAVAPEAATAQPEVPSGGLAQEYGTPKKRRVSGGGTGQSPLQPRVSVWRIFTEFRKPKLPCPLKDIWCSWER